MCCDLRHTKPPALALEQRLSGGVEVLGHGLQRCAASRSTRNRTTSSTLKQQPYSSAHCDGGANTASTTSTLRMSEVGWQLVSIVSNRSLTTV